MLAIGIDEDVGKRCCGIADVCALFEAVEEFSNKPIDGRHVLVGNDISISIAERRVRVDGCVVCLVVDHEQRHISDDASIRLGINLAPDADRPVEEILQDGLVFLHHEHNRLSSGDHIHVICDRAVEVACVRAACE